MSFSSTISHVPSKPVDLGCADKVVVGQTTNCMRPVANPAISVGKRDLRVMTFIRRDKCNRIHKCHGPGERGKFEAPLYQRCHPNRESTHGATPSSSTPGLDRRQWRNTTFAGFALPFDQFAHQAYLAPQGKRQTIRAGELTGKKNRHSLRQEAPARRRLISESRGIKRVLPGSRCKRRCITHVKRQADTTLQRETVCILLNCGRFAVCADINPRGRNTGIHQYVTYMLCAFH